MEMENFSLEKTLDFLIVEEVEILEVLALPVPLED